MDEDFDIHELVYDDPREESSSESEEEEEEEEEFTSGFMMFICAGLFEPSLARRMLLDGQQEERKKRSIWQIPMFAARDLEGSCAIDFPVLLANPSQFRNDFHMAPDTFEYILRAVGPSLEHPTRFRKPISPRDRLIIALR